MWHIVRTGWFNCTTKAPATDVTLSGGPTGHWRSDMTNGTAATPTRNSIAKFLNWLDSEGYHIASSTDKAPDRRILADRYMQTVRPDES